MEPHRRIARLYGRPSRSGLETLADPDRIAAGIRDELIALKFYPDTILGRKYVVVVYRREPRGQAPFVGTTRRALCANGA